MSNINKYDIRVYDKNLKCTSYSFDTVKELKKILSQLENVKVTPMLGLPKRFWVHCYNHNIKIVK